MLRRALPTVATASLLYGAYTLYAALLTPLFSPPSLIGPERAPAAVASGPRKNAQQARQYFPHEEWVANAKYQVRRDGTYMYAEEWEKVEPSGEVRFTPFAMIWYREGESAGQPPIVIQCDSARLQFESPFDEQNPQPGRIIGGALEGLVKVRGGDGLAVDAQNVQFSEAAQRVWSDNPISFAYGPHSGQALGLELDLVPGPREGDKPGVTGVKTVRLRKNVDMTLVQPPEPAKPGETIHIQSAGMFEYHLQERQASFQRTVHVEHPLAKGGSDTLDGELLTLFLEPAAGQLPKPKTGTLDGGLELRRMRAEGTPAVIKSSGSRMTARAAVLTYDVPTRLARLTHPQVVEVSQDASVIRCPDITFEHTPDGQIASAHGQGAGSMDGVEPPSGNRKPPSTFHATWTTDFKLEKDAEQVLDGTPLDRITLRGRAHVRQPGQMSLKGDVMQVWLVQQPQSPRGSADPQPPITLVGGNKADQIRRRKVRPHRMLAVGDVRFESPEITGKTQRLEANFEPGQLPLSRKPATQEKGEKQGTTIESSRASPPIPHPSSLNPLPSRGLASVPSTPPPPPKKPRLPAHLVADQIRLRVVQDGDQTDVAEAWNDGHLHVTQPRDAGEPPFELRGDRMHLVKFSDTDQVIDLVGQPALIQDRGFEIEGRELHLDRGNNSATVDGEGRLRLPVKNTPDGRPLPVPQPLDVRWLERMTFNGRTATFVSGVRAELGDHQMNCEQMQVDLSRPVNLASPSMENQKADLQRVRCLENVLVKSRETVEGRLVSVRHAKAWEFVLNQTTGETQAKGPPGSLMIWNRGHSRRAGLGAASGVQANKPLQPETAAWEYTQIDFSGTMTGNLKGRTSTFKDRVLVVHGPVPQPGEPVDPDALPRDGGWMRCDTLKLTQHAATEVLPAWVEMLATGNTELKGRPGRTAPLSSFHALADSISFDESKGLYLIRSQGHRGASLWRLVKPGLTPQPVISQRMEFIPARNHLKCDHVSVIDALE